MNNQTYCVIMAGGRGERFWPVSTVKLPKPFIQLVNTKTLLQLTVDRILPYVPKERIIVILGKDHYAVARKQLKGLSEKNFIREPEPRDTAPCIGYAARTLLKRDPEAVMVVVPADHYIPDVSRFIKVISHGVEVAKSRECLITIGVKPTRPETGYGYIRIGTKKLSTPHRVPLYTVTQFVEKPDITKARTYAKNPHYFWNAGIFVWKASVIMDAIRQYMPDLYQGLQRLPVVRSGGIIDTGYTTLPKISIDYGVMEKSDNVCMIPGRFKWDDVGTWSALKRLVKNRQFMKGKHIETIDTTGCVIYSDIPVGIIGVSHLIVAATEHGVLVCDMNQAQKVREIARRLNRVYP